MNVTEEDVLYSVSDLSDEHQEVFSDGFQYFNWIQSECFPQLYRADGNMVIGSPTGSGKTVLMELAMLRVLHKRGDQPGSLKIVYLAPTHALVNEKHLDWQQRFGKLGLSALALTRADILDMQKEIKGADIILTTPEKFDAITRKRKNLLMSFFADIALVLIDEVHILNEERGASLEAIVSRLKLVSQIPEMQMYHLPISQIRYIAVSATVPNIADIGQWLQCSQEGIKSYGDEMRPVKLLTAVLGYQPCKNNFMFEKNLNRYVYDVIMKYSKGKSTIVFCSSRLDSANCAQAISDKVNHQFHFDHAQADALFQESQRLEDVKLRALVPKGIAFHHAALCYNDKKVVEELFLSRHLVVLCSTSTLAYGVNLPAYLVVLKSARHWNSKTSAYEDYDRSLCLQMAGRAGRPQFESEGQCVIMTERAKVQRYRNLLGGLEEIESHLLPSIREHLNNEIGLLTIRTLEDCEQWLRTTFLGVRLRIKPKHYAKQMKLSCEDPDEFLKKVCDMAVADLRKLTMVEVEEATEKVKQLEPGRILSHYYLKMDTVRNFLESKDHLSLEGALWLVAASSEFSQTIIRRAERRTLNGLNTKGELRYFVPQPLKPDKPLKSLKKPCQKVFLLMQEALSIQSNSTLDHGLRMEREEFLRTGPRIAGAAAQYFVYAKKFAAAANCLILSKSFQHRLWPDSNQHCKQIPGVGPVISNRLAKANLSRLEDLERASEQQIESSAGQRYPFGSRIKSELTKFPPKTTFSVEVQNWTHIELVLSLEDETAKCPENAKAWVLIGCTISDTIIFSESISLDKMPKPYVVKAPISKEMNLCQTNFVAALITSNHFGRDLTINVHRETKYRSRNSIMSQYKSNAASAHKVAAVRPNQNKDDTAWQNLPAEPIKKGKETAKVHVEVPPAPLLSKKVDLEIDDAILQACRRALSSRSPAGLTQESDQAEQSGSERKANLPDPRTPLPPEKTVPPPPMESKARANTSSPPLTAEVIQSFFPTYRPNSEENGDQLKRGIHHSPRPISLEPAASLPPGPNQSRLDDWWSMKLQKSEARKEIERDISLNKAETQLKKRLKTQACANDLTHHPARVAPMESDSQIKTLETLFSLTQGDSVVDPFACQGGDLVTSRSLKVKRRPLLASAHSGSLSKDSNPFRDFAFDPVQDSRKIDGNPVPDAETLPFTFGGYVNE